MRMFHLFIYFYFWLCWVFVSVRGLSLVVSSGGRSSSPCAGLSLSRPLLLQSTGSKRAGSVLVAHGPSCSAACGIFPDQGSNPCPLHWQADSQPLRHQGSPDCVHFYHYIFILILLVVKLYMDFGVWPGIGNHFWYLHHSPLTSWHNFRTLAWQCSGRILALCFSFFFFLNRIFLQQNSNKF